VRKDTHADILKQIYMKYVSSPNNQLLVDANLMAANLQYKHAVNELLINYGKSMQEKIGEEGNKIDATFRQSQTEWLRKLYKVNSDSKYGHEGKFCIYYKIVWTISKKDEILGKIGGRIWAKYVHYVLEKYNLGQVRKNLSY
jgi:hypothetical protein